MVRTTENGITVLTSEEGMRLTNGNSFATTVRLGKGDSGESWHEVTEAVAEQMMEEALEQEELSETEAKAAAYDILMGVSE